MTQRITRQVVSILGSGVGNLRLTRQYMYVLWSILSPITADTLSFNETVDFLLTHQNITDSCAFNSTVVGTKVISKTIFDSLSFLNTAGRVFIESVAEDLIFDELPIFLYIPNDFNPAGDSLLFNETVIVEKPTERYIYDILAFNELATGRNATQWGVVAHNLAFEEVTTGHNPSIRQTVNDLLTLVDLISRTHTYTIADPVTFTEISSHLIIEVTDSLAFNESISFGHYQTLVDSMTLYGTVEYHADFLRSLIESLTIGHSLAYYLIRPCTNKQYVPFIGESTVSGMPDAPSLTLPDAVNSNSTSRFQMSFPAVGEFTDSVTLPAPEFENRDRLNFTRISRETRGGKLSVFADPNWPKINTVVCNFTGLTSNEVYILQTFIETHLGEEINITDWEGREWIGVITTPNEPATHDGKNKWSVGFEFEGVIVEYIVPGNNLTLNETVSYVVV